MNRSELLKTLELLKPALATTNTIPIFQCFCLNESHVSASSETIAIEGPLEVGDRACGIHGNTLLGLLSNSNAEEVEISLERENTALLKLGKTLSRLPFLSHDEFIFTKPDDEWDFKIPFTESTFAALKLCLDSVSSDETQQALLGVTIIGDRMYGCDGDTLARVGLKASIGAKNRVLMPTAFCEAVAKLWSTLAMTKGTLYFNAEWAFADFGDWSVYGRILTVPEPIDFDALITKEVKKGDKTLPVPEGLNAALSRARVLSDAESQKTVVSVEKGKLTLYTSTHMGEIKDVIPFKDHPDIKSNINASHLQSALQNCESLAFLEGCTLLEAPGMLQIVSNMT